MDKPEPDKPEEKEPQPDRGAVEEGGSWEGARRRFDAVYNDYLKDLERINADAAAHVERAGLAYRRAWLEASLELGSHEAVQEAWQAWLQAQTDCLDAVDAAARADAAWKKLIQGLRRAWTESSDDAFDPCLLSGIGQALIAAAAYTQSQPKGAGAPPPGR
jgi:hypothetical protein